MEITKTKLLHEVRAVKREGELASIMKAQWIAEEVLRDVLKFLKTGITEIEIAEFIKKSFVQYGAPILSFSPIVAFGKSSADIHHIPNKTKLKKGDIIMLDFGTTVNHYCSDMTRTYFWGQPNAKQKKLYLDVLEAMNRAFICIGKGEKKAKVIDKVARGFLARKYKNNFAHGLGHGVGTVIHEWPSFKSKSEDVLPVGCVMTIEPGIYLKGFGGVRIEDMILVTKNGYKNLTNVPKDLEDVILGT
ncbi:MAG: Peptidase M24 [Candidatus Nomurabacteria bacterium GW2011_GWA2_40_9]|uniref:Peptidase M24 n=1 Tax=Candidatus Nomurabacteria bacterium GW2011_GWA2_40_9 TaxID=1618734 RepID=A0A0G0TPZ3_9BACT|nr:MAG: Peptidase M24 [Candidatus Nomurabacteria bacterium GW2011_GWA2_40_9]